MEEKKAAKKDEFLQNDYKEFLEQCSDYLKYSSGKEYTLEEILSEAKGSPAGNNSAEARAKADSALPKPKIQNPESESLPGWDEAAAAQLFKKIKAESDCLPVDSPENVEDFVSKVNQLFEDVPDTKAPSDQNGETGAETGKANKKRKADSFTSEVNIPHFHFAQKGSIFIDEYESPDEAQAISEDLSSLCFEIRIKWIFTLIAILPMLWLDFAPMLGFSVPELLNSGQNPLIPASIHLVLGAFLMFVNWKIIIGGLHNLFCRCADHDTMASFSMIAAFVHALLVVLFTQASIDIGVSQTYILIPSVALLINLWSKEQLISRVRQNFRFLCTATEINSVVNISDEDIINSLSDEMMTADPQLCIRQRTHFFPGFLAKSYAESPSERAFRIMVPIIVIASVIINITACVKALNLMIFFAGLAVTCAMSFPISGDLSSQLALSRLAKILRSRGAMMAGFLSAKKLYDIGAIVLNDNDLFPENSVHLHGIKVLGNDRIDQVIIDVASIAKAANGPLGKVFMEVIDNKESLLHPVTSLEFYDEAGIIAVVESRRWIIGHAAFLDRQGVQIIGNDYEEKLEKLGKHSLFAACDGRLSALFVLEYETREEVASALRQLERHGIDILISTSDPNLSRKGLSERFGIGCNAINILSGTLKRKVEYHLGEEAYGHDAGVITTPSGFLGFVSSLIGSEKLRSTVMVNISVQIICAFLGFAMALIMVFFGSIGGSTLLQAFIYQLLWLIPILLFSLLRRY